MKIIDLTLVTDEKASIFPDPKYKAPELTFLYTPDADRLGRYSGHLEMHLHTGTHIDTPKHLGFDGGLDEVKLNVICGETIIIKLPFKDEGPITVEMVERYLPDEVETNGKRLIIMCGYNDAKWTKESYFQNVAYVSPELAQWIVDKGFVLVGLDMLTDGLPGLPSHKTLLGNSVYILEYLANYDAIPEGMSTSFLVTAPLCLRRMEASPVRAFLIQKTTELGRF